ncbi:MAG: putative Zn-dependent peptidase [Rhodothermales bacterium]|jgi:predicted Zn-dependent peptidase
MKRLSPILAALMLFAPAASGQELLSRFESSVTEFTLDNGLHFIVVERPEAPVVSFYTYADVGGVDEVKGITGIAHMFEHMAFKGTSDIGTSDAEAEAAAMSRVDDVYGQLRAEQHKRNQADASVVSELSEAFEAAKKEAQEFARGEFDEAITRNGGVGLNASTSSDATMYYYSLPANKVELWFSLESARFFDPVLREFYVERDVVMEERRMRTESSPVGRLLEEWLATAFKSHPYGEPVVGHMSDLQSFTREEAKTFFQKYYGPGNLTIAIVGAVNVDQLKGLAETYFGRLPKGPLPDPVETMEPAQGAERRVVITEESQPFVLVGYHKPSFLHDDDAAYSVLSDIMGRGRTSRIYRQLVDTEQLALQAASINNFPGNKYPNLFALFAVPNQGKTVEENEAAIYAIIEDVKTSGVTEEELDRAKVNARADLVRQLQANMGVAGQLAFYHAVTGDWRNLFSRLDQIDAVTNADIIRIATETFVPGNRTVAMIRTDTPETADAGSSSNNPSSQGETSARAGSGR